MMETGGMKDRVDIRAVEEMWFNDKNEIGG